MKPKTTPTNERNDGPKTTPSNKNTFETRATSETQTDNDRSQHRRDSRHMPQTRVLHRKHFATFDKAGSRYGANNIKNQKTIYELCTHVETDVRFNNWSGKNVIVPYLVVVGCGGCGCWLFGCLVGWLGDLLVGWLVGWVGGLAGWRVGGLVGGWVGGWLVVGGWWLVVGGWWLVVGGGWWVVGGGWLVVGGWWLVVGGWWLVVIVLCGDCGLW